jgi:hypothetical protein
VTRISFTRGLQGPVGVDPADPPPGRHASLGFVVACTALAVLSLLLCVTAFFTVRDAGKVRQPPRGATAVTVPIQEPPAMAVASPPPAVAAVPIQTAPRAAPAPAGTTAAPAPVRVDKSVAMLAILRQAKGTITLQIEDDSSARASGRDLAAFFRAAGWTVNVNSVTSSGPLLYGLSAALGDTPQDDAIRQAFRGAGIRLGPPPLMPGIVQTPEIFVGADLD